MPGPTFVTCTKCGLVYDSGAGSREVAPPRRSTRDRPSPDEGSLLRVETTDDRVVLSWPSSRFAGVLLLLLTAPIVWFTYWASFRSWPLFFILLPMSALMLYPALAFLFNRGTVTVDRASITTRDRPFPLSRSIECPLTGLEQIYVERIKATNRRFEHYCVTAYYGGKRADPFGGRHIAYTRNLALAREVEQRLERHLGIADRAEPREVPLDED